MRATSESTSFELPVEYFKYDTNFSLSTLDISSPFLNTKTTISNHSRFEASLIFEEYIGEQLEQSILVFFHCGFTLTELSLFV